MGKETLDPEAVEAYKEIAEEKGEDFRLPPGYKAPELPKEEDQHKEREEEHEEAEEVKLEEEEKEEEEETPSEEEQEKPEGEEEESEEEGEEAPEKEEESEEESKEDAESAIRQIAVDEGLKIEEAKERYEARQNIINKYKSDPKELAKALQNTQSAYDKIKNDYTEAQKTSKYDETAFKVQAEKMAVPAYVQENRENIIKTVREKNPRKTENMDDSDILNYAVKKYQQDIDKKYEKQFEEVKVEASKKRTEVLRQIPDEDKEFIPEVKEMIDHLADNQVVSANFDIQDFVKYARGEKYTPAYIKQVKEQAYKKGLEESKIVGEKRPVSQPASKKPAKPEGTASLTQRQKDRAVEMFPDEASSSPEKAYKMFREVHEEQLKKNPNFVS